MKAVDRLNAKIDKLVTSELSDSDVLEAASKLISESIEECRIMESSPMDIYPHEYIEEMQQELLENTVDFSFADVYYDGRDPEILKQCRLNFNYKLLKKLGKLPPGIE